MRATIDSLIAIGVDSISSQGVILERSPSSRWEGGYNLLVSDLLVLLADIRASFHHEPSEQEKTASDPDPEVISDHLRL